MLQVAGPFMAWLVGSRNPTDTRCSLALPVLGKLGFTYPPCLFVGRQGDEKTIVAVTQSAIDGSRRGRTDSGSLPTSCKHVGEGLCKA